MLFYFSLVLFKQNVGYGIHLGVNAVVDPGFGVRGGGMNCHKQGLRP